MFYIIPLYFYRKCDGHLQLFVGTFYAKTKGRKSYRNTKLPLYYEIQQFN